MLQIIAHRGASAYEPENTIRAIKKAIELGADAVEVDVRLSKDGQPVVIHDSIVDRTTNGSGPVASMTLEELRALDAGKGERIPTLEEVIGSVSHSVGLVVEVKIPGVEKKVVDILKKGGMMENSMVVSFYHRVVKAVKALAPEMRVGVIFSSYPVSPIRLAIEASADVLLPRSDYVDNKMIQKAHKLGLAIIPWTVDDPEEARRLMAMGVDGIATNRPDAIRDLRASLKR
ncbi:MAG: glycerophosphodiester phosphodiesterase [Candidatus Bathyarchaeia archaeon]